MRILLGRHGESEGNVNKSLLFEKPDHALELSPLGQKQAIECGNAIRDLGFKPKRIWVSPYMRTRQTAQGILQGYGPYEGDVRESIHLVEQQFGLFDGYPTDELAKIFPAEYAHYKKSEDFEGRFWARMPLGESRFDVTQRVHQFFGTIQRDADRHGIDDILVISHGVTIRAFMMMWCHHEWEWFEREPNPKNCSLHLIEDGSHAPGTIWQPTTPTNEVTKANAIP